MNHSDISLLVIQQNCSISATFIEASHYVYIYRYSITTVGLLICFIHFEWHRHNLHCVICLISWNENSCSISTYVQWATNDVYNNNLFSFNPKSSWKLKDYTAIENKWKRIISILIWKTFFLLIWWVVLSLLSLPLSHYLWIITFVKIVSALHVLMGHLLLLFFLRKTMVLTYHS